MSAVNSLELLRQLRKNIVAVQYKVENSLGSQTPAILQHAPAPGKWSAIQCLEHLNTYGRVYLPALDTAIANAAQRNSQPNKLFKSSWLGAYFTRLMQPSADGQLRSRMKSPKGHLPAIQPEVATVLQEFIQQQEQMEKLMLRAEKVNIQQIKIPTSLSRFIKLSAGDTFGFLTAHINRHVLQAERAVKSAQAIEKDYQDA
ncbi:DinB family protein [Chitinophaga arvensicola]|uniref:DinB superfamily protein n=1 Tax=Chitinophaga arvensicola TaxID=29529 RepID=A0A1I0PXJ2_9BACT|nr:DinB family protein [Chitinophaga arvensicola]SEW19068.1 DinB superfamily protein [Chitinophaga arvensicola]